ncbi:prolyl endopeptidase [mine drainage metagenome]|uniref:prolyl oligopeptidase n=3 Tax=mine drainage metagenome TaxID=410659 RepID=T1D5W8_9ZZZZ
MAALVWTLAPVPGAAAPGPLVYPKAYRDHTVDVYFGTRVKAPYQWMENLESRKLARWITAENRLTDAYLHGLPLRAVFYRRLRQIWNYAKEAPPIQRGQWLFFSHNTGIQNQSVVYVQRGPHGKPRVLLNPNRLSPNGTIALAGWEPSPNGRYLAYELSVGGSDWQTIHVLDVATGKNLPYTVRWVKFSNVSWTRNSQGFFYSRYPEPPLGKAISQRLADQTLYYHWIRKPQSDDRLIYARPDHPEWIIEGSVSENGRYLFIDFQFRITRNELYYMNLGNPEKPDIDGAIHPLFVRDDAAYTPIGTRGDTVYVQTDQAAPLGRVIAVNLEHPAPSRWRTVIPQGNGVLVSAHLADGRILVHRMVVAKSRLALYTRGGRLIRSLSLPDAMGTVGGISARADSPNVYFAFTSFLRPGEIERYDVPHARSSIFFRPDVSFDPDHYVVHQVFYRSTGGVRVPLFIVSRKGIRLNGKHPTILYGYGGFDITLTPHFSPEVATWLRLGGIYAMPNLRGGGVYGQEWHEAGMLNHKQNVFDDFANAARWLIGHHYTSVAHLGIMGYSNGGLLTGASVTQHPHLFGAVYVGHGVLDMLRFQKFSGGEYWISEYGTSSRKKDFKWLYAYSPLQNLKKGVCYPPTIITTSTDDDRVVPSNAYKFAAEMQRDQGCANPILLHVATATSHIYMPTDKLLRHDADNWGFIGTEIGMRPPELARRMRQMEF